MPHSSQPHRDEWVPSRFILAAALLHLLFFLPLFLHPRIHAIAVRNPGTTLGTRLTLHYSPGRAPSQASTAALKPVLAAPQSHAKATSSTRQPLSSSLASPAAANLNATPGSSSLGTGNVTIALATFFPWPRPEIPRGTHGDVIVEITIDEQGKIVDTRLAQSLGSTIDDYILATIHTWTFKPATKDGVPIPSEQELLFHYERG